jgi:hypothetical protein
MAYITLNNIELPNIQWIDEFAVPAITQTVKRTIAQTLVVYQNTIKNGIPITLESKADTGWIKRNDLISLYALANSAEEVMTLSIRNTQYQVIFRHQDTAIEAEPVFPIGNSPSDDEYYIVKIRLMTV